MTWRTIIVRDRAKLDYSLNFLTVRKEAETRKVSLSEIYMIIIESTAVSITAVLLNELMKNKIPSLSLRKKNNRQKTRNTKVKSLLFFIFVLL